MWTRQDLISFLRLKKDNHRNYSQEYLESDKKLRISRSMFGCALCIIFMPAGSLIDYLLYKNSLFFLLKGRLTCDLFLLITLLTHFSTFGKNNIRALTFTWMIIVVATMCWIISVTDGYISTYYAALSIFIFSVAVILPLSSTEMLMLCIITLVLYLVTNLDVEVDKNILFNNLYFICLSSTIGTISALLSSRARFKDFYLRHDLECHIIKLRLAQAQIVHSEKINAVGNLSAGLLHEVNNPLNYAITALQVMKMNPHVSSDADLKETAGDIEDGMMRIKGIITDLRAFAYPQAADKKFQFKIYEAVESALRFTAQETHDIAKVVNVPHDLMVTASKSHIVQVLINLITNAAKAINKAGREKGVITLSAKQENTRVTVYVADNGIGMNEETVQKVFDPFFTTSEIGKGLGLGLSVSHTIIKNHEGNFAVKSVFGEGSEFYFDLPS